MQVDGDGLVKEIFNWVLAGVAGLIAWAIKTTNSRIGKLEDCSVMKEEFREATKRATQDRDELRDSVVKLFDKIDEIKTILIRHNTDG